MLMLAGVTVNVQPWPCVIVTGCPATISVPDRSGPSVAATRNVTVPGPLKVLALLIVIQEVRLSAVQLQPAGADTAT